MHTFQRIVQSKKPHPSKNRPPSGLLSTLTCFAPSEQSPSPFSPPHCTNHLPPDVVPSRGPPGSHLAYNLATSHLPPAPTFVHRHQGDPKLDEELHSELEGVAQQCLAQQTNSVGPRSRNSAVPTRRWGAEAVFFTGRVEFLCHMLFFSKGSSSSSSGWTVTVVL